MVRAAGSIPEFVAQHFEARIYTNAHGALPYRLFVPANYSRTTPSPAVLFLHGKGACGTNNIAQLTDATGPLVFVTEANQRKNPSFMIAPQCTKESTWADAARRIQVHELMSALQKEFNFDADRLYITGISLGGYGTWVQLNHYPGMFAAAVPICGYGAAALPPETIIHLPIWDFHGADDDIVSVRNSRNIVAALRKAGGTPIYTEYATGGHFIWTAAYTTPCLLDWLYSQKRGTPSAKPPLVTITEPGSPPSAVTAGTINLNGTAYSCGSSPTSITWTNYQNGRLALGGGIADGRSHWAITNLSLSASCTNLIVITATTTSYSSSQGGHTTFNAALRMRP